MQEANGGILGYYMHNNIVLFPLGEVKASTPGNMACGLVHLLGNTEFLVVKMKFMGF